MCLGWIIALSMKTHSNNWLEHRLIVKVNYFYYHLKHFGLNKTLLKEKNYVTD
jgi:hypothetical protein